MTTMTHWPPSHTPAEMQAAERHTEAVIADPSASAMDRYRAAEREMQTGAGTWCPDLEPEDEPEAAA